MRLRHLLAACLLAPCLAAATGPGSDPCTLSHQVFSETVDALDSWAGIHAYQQRHFPPCVDEGMFAQAHSELVVRTLAERWTQLGELDAALRASPAFRDFVFRHINERSGRGPLQVILTHTTIRCPRQQVALCQELRGAVARALQALQ